MTNNPLANISAVQLNGLLRSGEQMQTLQNELDRLAGGQTASGQRSAALHKRGTMSAEARAELSATITARWAKIRAAKTRAAKARK